MANPLVSVIVSAYNRPEMLKLALASLQAQTYVTLEIIVQDDSTDDECAAVVAAAADSRMRYTHNFPALGTARNLLAGYRKATGKYFCTLNDDDLYAPNYIDVMVQQLEGDANVSVAFCDHFMIDGNGAILPEKTESNTRRWRRDILREGTIRASHEVAIIRKSIPAMLAVFRRDAVDLADFPDEVSSGYDFWLSYLAVRNGNPIYYTPRRLAYYRSHDESQTASFANPAKRLSFARYSQYMHTRFLSDGRLKDVHGLLIPQLAQDHSAAGFALLRLSRRGEAAKELSTSLRLRPTLRSLTGLALCAAPSTILKRVLQTS